MQHHCRVTPCCKYQRSATAWCRWYLRLALMVARASAARRGCCAALRCAIWLSRAMRLQYCVNVNCAMLFYLTSSGGPTMGPPIRLCQVAVTCAYAGAYRACCPVHPPAVAYPVAYRAQPTQAVTAPCGYHVSAAPVLVLHNVFTLVAAAPLWGRLLG